MQEQNNLQQQQEQEKEQEKEQQKELDQSIHKQKKERKERGREKQHVNNILAEFTHIILRDNCDVKIDELINNFMKSDPTIRGLLIFLKGMCNNYTCNRVKKLIQYFLTKCESISDYLELVDYAIKEDPYIYTVHDGVHSIPIILHVFFESNPTELIRATLLRHIFANDSTYLQKYYIDFETDKDRFFELIKLGIMSRNTTSMCNFKFIQLNPEPRYMYGLIYFAYKNKYMISIHELIVNIIQQQPHKLVYRFLLYICNNYITLHKYIPYIQLYMSRPHNIVSSIIEFITDNLTTI